MSSLKLLNLRIDELENFLDALIEDLLELFSVHG
jgi:hypothetical protein